MSALKYPKHLKREASAWRVMHRRCREKKFRDYPRYGGAGILICPQWESFDQFISDVGPAPTPAHWLGRRDTAGNYTPENVTWTTQPEQVRRRQFCRKVTIHDQTLTAAEAGRLPGLPSRNSVLHRVAGGFSLEAPKLAKLYRASTWITYQGETLPLPEWARRIGLHRSVLWHRIKSGMAVELAMSPSRLPQQQKTPAQKPTEKEISCQKQ
jgi:hypothetical protein